MEYRVMTDGGSPIAAVRAEAARSFIDVPIKA